MGYAEQCAADERASDALRKVPELEAKIKELKTSLDLVTREYLGGAGDIYLKTLMNRVRINNGLDPV